MADGRRQKLEEGKQRSEDRWHESEDPSSLFGLRFQLRPDTSGFAFSYDPTRRASPRHAGDGRQKTAGGSRKLESGMRKPKKMSTWESKGKGKGRCS